MSSQYCMYIINPYDEDIDIEDLKLFVHDIYVGSKKHQFKPDQKIPFIVVHSRADNSVCVLLTGKSKKVVEQIEEVNEHLTEDDLMYKDNITLSEPYQFNQEIVDWWTQNTQGKPNLKGKRWTTLSHRGPYFTHLMEPYQSMGASLIYNGVRYPLTPKEEQIAGFYAKRKISEAAGGIVDEWTKDDVFNKNYWNDFKKYLTPEHTKIFKDFSKIDWSDLITRIESAKANEISKTDKTQKKIRAEEKKHEYAYAYIDGYREKVGNFTIEPQAIFYGRGANPNRGRIKKEINPEDVTINIGLTDKVPNPPPDHKWGNIVHDQDAVWLAKWNDSITGDTKYVMLGAESRFKGESDLDKYEKARKLEKYIDDVRTRYMADAASQDTVKMQLGTVLYLIDHFGVRVGNERKEDEADTVGASTLEVAHVKLVPPDKTTGSGPHVIFDFLGKDSIRFYKDLDVPQLIYDNFSKLVSGKKGTEQVFHSISSRNINEYLKTIDKSFSAKVFRTRLASETMYEALRNVKIPKDTTKAKAKMLFNKANAEVAEVLNHTRNVSKKAQQSVQKFRDELAQAEVDLATARRQGKSTTILDKKIENLKNKIESKTDVMTIAINTSLTNYIDPRLIVSWSLQQKVDLTAIYSSTLMRKFSWAIETTKDTWNWMTSPLLGSQDLEPLKEGDVNEDNEENKPKRSRTRKEVSKEVVKVKPHAPPKVKPIAKPVVKPKEIAKPVEKPKETVQPTVQQVSVLNKAGPSLVGPGTKEDYELVLNICRNPEKYKFQFTNVPKNVLEWIYPFSKYAIDHLHSNIIANDYIVKFYEVAYKGKVQVVETPREIILPTQPRIKRHIEPEQIQPKVHVPADLVHLTLLSDEELRDECTKNKVKCGPTRSDMLRALIAYLKSESTR